MADYTINDNDGVRAVDGRYPSRIAGSIQSP
jgi:hypothetical protein